MNKRLLRLLLIISVVSYGGQIFLYPRLPPIVATHWDLQGKIDSWGPKNSLLILGALPLVLLFILWLLPRIDPRRENYQKHTRAYSIFSATLTLVIIGINWVITLFSLGVPLPATAVIQLLVGLLLLILGNYMPQLRSNFFLGFRTPWTIDSETVWRKTNRAGGIVFCICGLLMMVLAFVPLQGIILLSYTPLPVGCVGVFIYSYYIYKKMVSKKEDPHAED